MATICDKCGSNMVLDGETWACASPTCGHTQQSMQAKKCQCGGVIIQVRVRLCFRLIRGGKAWASVYWLRRTSFSTGPQPALPPVSFTAVAMSHLFSELSLSLSLSLSKQFCQASQIIAGASASTWICSDCQKTRDFDTTRASRRQSLVNAPLGRSSSLDNVKGKQGGGRCCGLFGSTARSAYVQPDDPK